MHKYLKTLRLCLGGVIIASTFLTGCHGQNHAPETVASDIWQSKKLRDIQLESKTITLKDGRELAYEQGLIAVPQNRRAGTSAMMNVEFFRFKAKETAPKGVPPVFIMNGGPGHTGLQEDLENPGYYEFFLERYTEFADVIVPGQRGFGTSGDTPCDPIDTLPLSDLVDREKRFDNFKRATISCQKKWAATEFDITGMNVVEAAADIGDLVESLGYEQVQLWGNSFGSHLGLAALRTNPALFARATFGALEGFDHTYDVPSQTVATMERILSEAETSDALKSLIPEGGLLNAYQDLINLADKTPIPVEIVNPTTEKPDVIALNGDDFRDLVRGYSGRPFFRYRMHTWPQDLLTILGGDYTEAAQTHIEQYHYMRLSRAAYYHYDCGSGVSEARGKIIRNDPAADLIGETWRDLDVDCEAWGADLGEDFRTDFKSNVPVVLIHGTWDMGTSYENVHEVSQFFEQHKVVTVEGGSHGAMREAEENGNGFTEALEVWMRTGDWEEIPTRIELPALSWKAP